MIGDIEDRLSRIEDGVEGIETPNSINEENTSEMKYLKKIANTMLSKEVARQLPEVLRSHRAKYEREIEEIKNDIQRQRGQGEQVNEESEDRLRGLNSRLKRFDEEIVEAIGSNQEVFNSSIKNLNDKGAGIIKNIEKKGAEQLLASKQSQDNSLEVFDDKSTILYNSEKDNLTGLGDEFKNINKVLETQSKEIISNANIELDNSISEIKKEGKDALLSIDIKKTKIFSQADIEINNKLEAMDLLNQGTNEKAQKGFVDLHKEQREDQKNFLGILDEENKSLKQRMDGDFDISKKKFDSQSKKMDKKTKQFVNLSANQLKKNKDLLKNQLIEDKEILENQIIDNNSKFQNKFTENQTVFNQQIKDNSDVFNAKLESNANAITKQQTEFKQGYGDTLSKANGSLGEFVKKSEVQLSSQLNDNKEMLEAQLESNDSLFDDQSLIFDNKHKSHMIVAEEAVDSITKKSDEAFTQNEEQLKKFNEDYKNTLFEANGSLGNLVENVNTQLELNTNANNEQQKEFKQGYKITLSDANDSLADFVEKSENQLDSQKDAFGTQYQENKEMLESQLESNDSLFDDKLSRFDNKHKSHIIIAEEAVNSITKKGDEAFTQNEEQLKKFNEGYKITLSDANDSLGSLVEKGETQLESNASANNEQQKEFNEAYKITLSDANGSLGDFVEKSENQLDSQKDDFGTQLNDNKEMLEAQLESNDSLFDDQSLIFDNKHKSQMIVVDEAVDSITKKSDEAFTQNEEQLKKFKEEFDVQISDNKTEFANQLKSNANANIEQQGNFKKGYKITLSDANDSLGQLVDDGKGQLKSISKVNDKQQNDFKENYDGEILTAKNQLSEIVGKGNEIIKNTEEKLITNVENVDALLVEGQEMIEAQIESNDYLFEQQKSVFISKHNDQISKASNELVELEGAREGIVAKADEQSVGFEKRYATARKETTNAVVDMHNKVDSKLKEVDSAVQGIENKNEQALNDQLIKNSKKATALYESIPKDVKNQVETGMPSIVSDKLPAEVENQLPGVVDEKLEGIVKSALDIDGHTVLKEEHANDIKNIKSDYIENKEQAQQVWDEISQKGEGAVSEFGNKSESVLNELSESKDTVLGDFDKTSKTVLNDYKASNEKLTGELKEQVSDSLKENKESVDNYVQEGKSQIKKSIENAGTQVQDLVKDGRNQFKEAVDGVGDVVESKLNDLVAEKGNKFDKQYDKFTKVGAKAITTVLKDADSKVAEKETQIDDKFDILYEEHKTTAEGFSEHLHTLKNNVSEFDSYVVKSKENYNTLMTDINNSKESAESILNVFKEFEGKIDSDMIDKLVENYNVSDKLIERLKTIDVDQLESYVTDLDVRKEKIEEDMKTIEVLVEDVKKISSGLKDEQTNYNENIEKRYETVDALELKMADLAKVMSGFESSMENSKKEYVAKVEEIKKYSEILGAAEEMAEILNGKLNVMDKKYEIMQEKSKLFDDKSEKATSVLKLLINDYKKNGASLKDMVVLLDSVQQKKKDIDSVDVKGLNDLLEKLTDVQSHIGEKGISEYIHFIMKEQYNIEPKQLSFKEKYVTPVLKYTAAAFVAIMLYSSFVQPGVVNVTQKDKPDMYASSKADKKDQNIVSTVVDALAKVVKDEPSTKIVDEPITEPVVTYVKPTVEDIVYKIVTPKIFSDVYKNEKLNVDVVSKYHKFVKEQCKDETDAEFFFGDLIDNYGEDSQAYKQADKAMNAIDNDGKLPKVDKKYVSLIK